MANVDYDKYGLTVENSSPDYSKYGLTVENQNQINDSQGKVSSPTNNAANNSSVNSLGLPLPFSLAGNISELSKLGGNVLGGALTSAHNLRTLMPWSDQTPINYYKLFGVENPSIPEQVARGVGQYAPFALAPEVGLEAAGLKGLTGTAGFLSRLGGEGLAGAAFGASQSPAGERGTGAIENALLNTVLHGASEGLPALKGMIQSKKAQYAAPGLAQSMQEALTSPKNVTNNEIFDIAKNNLNENVLPTVNQKWDNLTENAKAADNNPNLKFDNSSYKGALENKLSSMKEESSRQSALARQNAPAIELIEGNPKAPEDPAQQGYLNDQSGTFQSAFEHNKALNADFRNTLPTTGSPPDFTTVRFAKNSLENTIQENLEKNGLQNTLGQAWQDAKQATADLHNTFYQNVSTKGKNQTSTFKNYVKMNPTAPDRGNFINDYLPNNKADSIGRMQNLAKMIGDEDLAKSAIKKNYFDLDQPNTPDRLIKKYNNLSPEERNYLFDDNQNKTFQALNKIKEQHSDIFNKGHFTSFFHSALPAIFGGEAAHLMGGHMLSGAIATAIGKRAVERGIGKYYARPAQQEYWRDYLTNPQSTAPTSPTNNLLREKLMQSILNPALQGNSQ